jgi:DNA-binding transcriptional ArsR family regulator
MSKYQKDNIARYADVFRALSNPNRLRMFLRLVSCCRPGTVWSSDCGLKTCVGTLGEEMGIGLSTVSHHLRELRRAGLIRMERNGQRVECWVDPHILEELSGFFGFPLVEERANRLSGEDHEP